MSGTPPGGAGDSGPGPRDGGPDTRERVALLERPDAYPHRPERVEVVETHMAWVFLAGDRAYKMKKPVREPFLDFRTLEARREDARREVELNRRLAPDVYLRTAPVTREEGGGLALDGDGTPVEWLVVMRRLDRDRFLDRALEGGRAGPADVRPAAELLARFFRDAPPEPMEPGAYLARTRRRLEDSLRELAAPDLELDGEPLSRLRSSLPAWLDARGDLLRRRAADRRIVEGHGDLRPEHVHLGPPPVVIDCVEFRRSYRILDPAEELAFLSMECRRLDAPWVREVLLETYRRIAGDAPPAALVDFYAAGRACLRAKLTAWHAREDRYDSAAWLGRARGYLELACDLAAGVHSGPQSSRSDSPE